VQTREAGFPKKLVVELIVSDSSTPVAVVTEPLTMSNGRLRKLTDDKNKGAKAGELALSIDFKN